MYGALNGASDGISITIRGRQSHGAYPDLGVDAIAIAGQVITALQNVVSRNVSPLDSAVLTLGTIKGGVKGNVIADEVKITGTLRTINPNTRRNVKERIKAIVTNIAESFGGEGKVEFEEGYAALINSSEVVEEIISTVKENFGEEALVIKEMPSLGVEDFSYFIDAAKGAFYHLGCGNVEKNITAPLHNECFDIDEDCLPLGVLTHTLIALRLLEKK
ncbi:N-acetyldiaminopimelate deacetylase [bioreactor metagenome]|uniref:N-acetyldiaminopimelate deacetylase n=1 Tax=bioreactor metagenome TaxID=1076179 RepID=A0A645CRK0_9ZZZZ